MKRQGGKTLRIVLAAVLILALIVLAVVAAVLVPILTHRSAGGSGQQIVQGFVPSTSAVGADGRTRELRVERPAGGDADLSAIRPADELLVRGSGFDPGIGIYVAICKVPDVAGEKPGPCLGGVPEGATEGKAAGDEAASSAWITDDWAWRAFASKGFDDPATGSFSMRLLVPEPVQEGLDCTVQRCAVTTRADHTAARDRVQDVQLLVAFAE